MASAPLERSGMAAANPRAVAPAPGARFALIDWRDCEDALTLAEWDELAQSVSEPNPFCESWNLLPALGGFARAGEVELAVLRVDGELCGLMPLARSAGYYGYPIPHFVRNGPESSISLSITWRSDWSFAEADARGWNRRLRRVGISPAAPRRWPATNRAKALAFRALRRLGFSD